MRSILIILVILLLAVQVQLWKGVRDVRALSASVAEQRIDNEALQARNEALFAEVRDLREGLEAIEERARAELGLVGPDEDFYLLIDPATAPESTRPPPSEDSPF